MVIDISFLDREFKRVNESIVETKTKVTDLQASIALLEETKEFMTKVLYIKKSEMNILIEIVNRGLKFIYPNKDLIFDMRFEEKSNRVVPEFYIGDNKLDNKLLKGNGGGVVSAIGIFIYITFLKLRNIKIALIDEIDSQIDPQATELLLDFLDYFSKENGMSVLMITQKELEDYIEIEVTNKITMLRLD